MMGWFTDKRNTFCSYDLTLMKPVLKVVHEKTSVDYTFLGPYPIKKCLLKILDKKGRTGNVFAQLKNDATLFWNLFWYFCTRASHLASSSTLPVSFLFGDDLPSYNIKFDATNPWRLFKRDQILHSVNPSGQKVTVKLIKYTMMKLLNLRLDSKSSEWSQPLILQMSKVMNGGQFDSIAHKVESSHQLYYQAHDEIKQDIDSAKASSSADFERLHQVYNQILDTDGCFEDARKSTKIIASIVRLFCPKHGKMVTQHIF